jgi:hypothetical protein
MAAGDFTIFTQAKNDIQKGVHNIGTDTYKFGLIGNAVPPSETTADPRWGAGGTTNFSSQEVTPGGNYAAGGPTITLTPALNSPNAKVTASTINIAQHASNPTGVYWAIIYNSTSAGKEALGFVELGTNLNLTTGAFSWTPNATALFTTS